MQNASQEYKESMSQPLRNQGYIRISIGVINSEAQKAINVNDERNNLTYFSNKKNLFEGYEVEKVYATEELDFS